MCGLLVVLISQLISLSQNMNLMKASHGHTPHYIWFPKSRQPPYKDLIPYYPSCPIKKILSILSKSIYLCSNAMCKRHHCTHLPSLFWALRLLRWEQNSRRKRHCRHRQPSPPPPPPPPSADSLSWRYRQLVIEKAPTC